MNQRTLTRTRLARAGAAAIVVFLCHGGVRAAETNDALFAGLAQQLHSDNALERKQAADSWLELGPAARPGIKLLLEILNAEQGEVSEEIADVIGRLGTNSLPSVLDAFNESDLFSFRIGNFHAVQAIVRRNATIGPVLRESFIKLDGVRRILVVKALTNFGPPSEPSITVFRAAAVDPDPSVRQELAEGLARVGRDEPSLNGFLIALLSDREPKVRQKAAAAFQSIQPRGEYISEKLAPLLTDPEEQVRWAAGYSLRVLDPLPTSWLETLLVAITKDPKLYLIAGVPLAKVAGRAQREQDDVSLPVLRKSLIQLQKSTNEIYPFEQADFADQVMSPLQNAIDSLSRDQKSRETRRSLAWASGALGFALVLALAFTVSPEARIWFQVFLLRRRWHLNIETCEHRIAVSRFDSRIRIAALSADSAFEPVDLHGQDGWPIPEKERRRLLTLFKVRETIRLEIDESLFQRPWASVIGSEWTKGRSANIAGQVIGTRGFKPTTSRFSDELRLALLACSTACGARAPLLWARTEQQRIREALVRPNIKIHQQPGDTSIGSLQKALRDNDILHVSAHATPDGIFLHQGELFTCRHVAEMENTIRCRLLILSSCKTGETDNRPYSLAYKFVRLGVNVLAARGDIQDSICPAFFGAFYRALFPKHRNESTQIADAIREATHRCLSYWACLLKTQTSDERVTHLFRDLNEFVLFGDPTLKFVFRRPNSSMYAKHHH